MDNQTRFANFLRRYQEEVPFYSDFDASGVPVDAQGYQSPENVRFFSDVFHEFHPHCLLELGSWKGTSAIMFAKHMLAYCDNPLIGCIDTWLGSIEHWNNKAARGQLGLRHGYPTLYERFTANVIRAGVAQHITPLPMTTRTGLAAALMNGAKADAIYVDASHVYLEVLEDLQGVWQLIDDGGFIMADDYNAPSVRRAIQEFCARPGVFGLYNQDSGWPEALLVKSAVMRERAIAAHPPLVAVPIASD